MRNVRLYTVHQPIDVDGLTNGTDLLALLPLPAGWLAAVPGLTLSAVHTLLLSDGGLSDGQAVEVAQGLLGAERLLGSRLRDDSASLYTTFRMRPDGTSRFVILCDTRMTEGRAGRVSGAVLDMERYRMLALLAYPTAREVGCDWRTSRRAWPISPTGSRTTGPTTASCSTN